MIQSRKGIFITVFRIINKLYIVLIDEIIKLLLEVSYHDGDVSDPHFMKLSYLSLDHAFPEYLQKSLWSLIGKRHKS